MSKSDFRGKIDFKDILEEAKDLPFLVPALKRKARMRHIFRLIKIFSYVVIFCVLFLVGLLVYSAFDIKLIFQEFRNGKNNIEQALYAFKAADYPRAEAYSASAQSNFTSVVSASQRLSDNWFFSRAPFAYSEINNVYHLGASAEILSAALLGASDFGQRIVPMISGEHSFTALDPAGKTALLEFLYESGPELNGLKSNIELALLNSQQVATNGILFPFKSQILKYQAEIEEIRDFLSQAVPLSEALPFVLGYPENQIFLVLIQNSTELRPTGGFIGTYGIVETSKGEIVRHDTHDVYHLDMPVQDKISVDPPPPLKEYLGVDKWYFRDSNWSPDWPTAAKKAEWFFYEEDKLLPPKDQVNKINRRFDGVIGINPVLITDLLKLVGPVEIEGQAYNSGNFLDLLEYRVEKGYVQLGVSSWQRKEVIGDIAKELKERIFALPPAELKAAIDVLAKNLREKNILVALNNSDNQEIFAKENWDGAVVDHGGDYFFVVDANMAAFKTDAAMDRRIKYSLNEGVNGIFSDLDVAYKHSGGFDWKTTRYRTYTRIYLPLGTELISVEGFTSPQFETYSEFGKMVVGGFISIEPGQINNLHLRYKLPEHITRDLVSGRYRLYVQKQPGSRVSELEIDLGFEQPAKGYYPDGFYSQAQDNFVRWNLGLENDREFTVYF